MVFLLCEATVTRATFLYTSGFFKFFEFCGLDVIIMDVIKFQSFIHYTFSENCKTLKTNKFAKLDFCEDLFHDRYYSPSLECQMRLEVKFEKKSVNHTFLSRF